jgi:hypothetical protein
MSGKIRVFTVSGFLLITPPFTVIAHSKLQLLRRLSERLIIDASLLADVSDALWRGHPVFMTDIDLVLLPGRFSGISYQVLSLPSSQVAS